LAPEFEARLKLLGQKVGSVKLVGDLPLEWLPVDGVALMLRHDCSRIPATPLNLAYMCAMSTRPIFIDYESLLNVLVVRSYSEDDPVRGVLERAIAIERPQAARTVSVQFIDVTSEDQLVSAINNHEGAIVIFDCHSSFDESSYVSGLVIGGARVHLPELKGRIRLMPPIVLLSSCDTLPVDGSHGSVAVGCLLMGARTVIATQLPVNAVSEAVFIGRLLLRIEQFVPLLLSHVRNVTWRDVMGGMLRMLHATDVLLAAVSNGNIPAADYTALHTFANAEINGGRSDWLEALARKVAEVAGVNVDRARNWLCVESGLTHALLHAQLGQPETIVLHAMSGRVAEEQVSIDQGQPT
jgi:hypothetical protein